jgi:putative PIN family toxin of toxin-antitoxin system
VLVSVLLAYVRETGTLESLIDSAIQGDYHLVLAEEVLDEIQGAHAKKPFLKESISHEQLRQFIELLRGIAEIVPRQIGPIPEVLRDPKDDFLLTAAAIGDADYLVTGDRDLLDIREHLTRPRIVTVAEFLQFLAA